MISNSELLEAPKRRHVQELNLVPIIDMLTTVIFFLLLSMSFVQYNKLSVPESSVSIVSSKDKLPELQPKLLLVPSDSGALILVLKWPGAKAGELKEEVSNADLELEAKSKEMLAKFKAQHPEEKVLQLALAPTVPYSKLVLLMDSAKEYLSDVVLLSSKDAERLTASHKSEGL